MKTCQEIHHKIVGFGHSHTTTFLSGLQTLSILLNITNEFHTASTITNHTIGKAQGGTYSKPKQTSNHNTQYFELNVEAPLTHHRAFSSSIIAALNT